MIKALLILIDYTCKLTFETSPKAFLLATGKTIDPGEDALFKPTGRTDEFSELVFCKGNEFK